MWNEQIIMMLLEGIKDTLYMTLTSTLIGYVTVSYTHLTLPTKLEV